jgi:hypothetical protein
MKKIILIALACLSLLATSARAEDKPRQENIHFQKGKSSLSLKGRIKGYEYVHYKINAHSGQKLAVHLKSSNLSNYFNILPPGEESALFIGSSSGNHFSRIVSKNGNYTVDVYLMRNAARRNEVANYSIEFKLTGEPEVIDAKLGPKHYDASANIKCSTSTPKLDKECGVRVLRNLGQQSAEMWIANIAYSDSTHYRMLKFTDQTFTSNDQASISWQRKDDNWLVAIDGKEFYFIPDALIHGG